MHNSGIKTSTTEKEDNDPQVKLDKTNSYLRWLVHLWSWKSLCTRQSSIKKEYQMAYPLMDSSPVPTTIDYGNTSNDGNLNLRNTKLHEVGDMSTSTKTYDKYDHADKSQCHVSQE